MRACELSYINSAAQSKLCFQKEHSSGEGSEDSRHAALQSDEWKIVLSLGGGERLILEEMWRQVIMITFTGRAQERGRVLINNILVYPGPKNQGFVEEMHKRFRARKRGLAEQFEGR